MKLQNFLDIGSEAKIISILKKLKDKITIIFITHKKAGKELCDEVFDLDGLGKKFVNIYIKLEILSRELKAKMLLGMYAAAKGHQVLIGDEEILRLIENKKLNPGIILEKSITPAESRINQLKNYNENKSIVTSLDEETPLSTNNLDLFCEVRFSKETLNLSKKVFCWSNYDYEVLAKHFPSLKKSFLLIGKNRMELWKEKYNDLYKSEEIKKKRYIMISSNIGVGLWNSKYSDVIRMLRKNGYFKNKEYEKYFFSWMKYNFSLLHKFTSAIDYLTEISN